MNEPERRWNHVVGEGAGEIVPSADGIFLTSRWGRTLNRLDGDARGVTDVMSLGKSPGKMPVGLEVRDDRAWVVTRNGWLSRMSTADLAISEGVARLGRRARALVGTAENLWVLRRRGDLLRIVPETGDVDLAVRTHRSVRRLYADGGDTLLVVAGRGRKLIGLHPSTGEQRVKVRLPGRCVDLVSGGATVWAGCKSFGRNSGTLVAVNHLTGLITGEFDLPGEPRAVTKTPQAVLVATWQRDRRWTGVVHRLDPSTGEVRTIVESTGWPVNRLAVKGDLLLATMSTRPAMNVDDGSPWFVLDGGGGGGDGGGGGHGGGHGGHGG